MTALYDTREQFLMAFIEGARPRFEAVNAPLPSNIRVSVGFTSAGSRAKSGKRRIAEVWSDTASGDGHFEIFIEPTINEVTRLCDALTHELAHCAVGLEANHNATFKRVVTSLGLVGKASETVAGQAWFDWAGPLITSLGDMPYAALSGTQSSKRPGQKTNMKKLECPACGFIARATMKHISPHSFLNCPVPDCPGELICEEVAPE